MTFNENEKPLFAGFLKKKGGTFKALRERYFVLQGKHLFYFKSQKDKKPAGFIDLTGASVTKDRDRKYGIFIDGPLCTRKYELQSDSEVIVDTWIAKIREAIEQIPESENEKAKTSTPAKKEADDEEQILFNHTGNGSAGKKVGLSDFALLTVIGRGSFGKVLKVRKRDTGEIFAMKVLRKDMVVKENMVAHTKAEKAILQQVSHPFIVGLRYAFQTKEKLYLILDFLSGGELFFHLKLETKFSEARAKFYAAEIALAISHLHSQDIIYRDLKPENVVLDKHGHSCLTDFGLAKTSISSQTPTYTFCGTPEYLAPEILKGQGHGKAVDWWSLGVLLYEMLVGLPPFYSENVNDMYELILKAQLKFPSFVSPNAQSLLTGLLERDEFKRLGSSGDFEDIKNHPFFQDIDWDKLYRKEVPPPFVPELKDDEDTKYFDSEFTEESTRDSFAEKIRDEEDDFGGFTFENKSVLRK